MLEFTVINISDIDITIVINFAIIDRVEIDCRDGIIVVMVFGCLGGVGGVIHNMFCRTVIVLFKSCFADIFLPF